MSRLRPFQINPEDNDGVSLSDGFYVIEIVNSEFAIAPFSDSVIIDRTQVFGVTSATDLVATLIAAPTSQRVLAFYQGLKINTNDVDVDGDEVTIADQGWATLDEVEIWYQVYGL